MPNPNPASSFHVTVLSNFARAYDKYSRCYDKTSIPESSFPDVSYVIALDELDIGISKATRLLDKLGLPGNRLLVLETNVLYATLEVNARTGKGRCFPSPQLPVAKLWYLDKDQQLIPVIPEEAYAASMVLLHPQLYPYTDLAPRTVSVLPIARACQAACRFCFSESSASVEQHQESPNWDRLDSLCQAARDKGATRFVITGGGEPGLLPHSNMLRLIRQGHQHFKKVVLITNGVDISRRHAQARTELLSGYHAEGLSVLAVSRHHSNSGVNRVIMGLDTKTEALLESWRNLPISPNPLQVRLICVLQQGGIEDEASLAEYLNWGTQQGVSEFCFKELYVSSTLESAYHANPENQWALQHQVSLSLVTHFLTSMGFIESARLPWGAPILTGPWNGQTIHVAAYTEPSLFWERSTGIARSWNIMSDGQCLASLEDPTSIVGDSLENLNGL